MGEQNMDLLPLTQTLTGDRTGNLGVCPDEEWNLQPFSLQDGAPTHWRSTSRPGLLLTFNCVYSLGLFLPFIL